MKTSEVLGSLPLNPTYVAKFLSYSTRGRTGGRPRTDVAKLENARILYQNSGKTATEVCRVAGVGRRVFFAYLAQKHD